LAITVLLILAAMWAAVLLPPVLRARTVQRSGDTIGDFSHRLSALGRRTGRRHAGNDARGRIDSLARLQSGPVPGAPAVPMARPGDMTPMQRRRRDVLLSLAGATVGTFLLAAVTGAAIVWFAWFLAAAATGSYVWLLLRMKQQASERDQKVRFLDARRPMPAEATPDYALTRSAGS
jgi:hypothetical protein